MFCKKCGSILIPKRENDKTFLECPKCGYKEVAKSIEIKEKKEKKKAKENEIEVVYEEHEAMPVVEATCPKCGNDKAYFFTMQTRAADEPETRFYKCTKCKHTWREYS